MLTETVVLLFPQVYMQRGVRSHWWLRGETLNQGALSLEILNQAIILGCEAPRILMGLNKQKPLSLIVPRTLRFYHSCKAAGLRRR